MKIVFLDTITMGSDISLEPISSLGDYIAYESSTPEQALERVSDSDVLIINKVIVDKELIDAAKNLRLICVAATGTNNVDIPYAESKGIAVKNAVNYSSESVAQVTIMHLLALVGKSRYFDDVVKSGTYSASSCFTDVSNPFFELRGKVFGVIGLGNIGKRVASILGLFGMKVVYFSASGNAHSDLYPCLSLDDLLTQSDIISIHAPLNEKTNNLITYTELSKMKKSAYIINMGRGGIINEEDLARAIDDNIISGAAVDVFVKEPLTSDHPYLKVKNKENLILSPHIAWASREARELLVQKIADNIS